MGISETENWFALVFEGFISIPADGVYTFYCRSDDGTILYIDKQLVVDNDFNHGMIEKS